jgi:hypothetical protein
MGGLISGILGGGESEAQAAQQKELAAARQAMQQYRPEAMQARINLFNNASSAYQGANNALETMYGGRSKPDPWGSMRGRTGEPQKPQVVMGHEMPQQPIPGQVTQQRPRIGEGDGWEDTAAQFIDPAGIFRRFF